MNNCWKVLGIAPTGDIETVRRIYRDLVKRYHPDRARSPEKVRHYTIKCAEINEAYRQALQECAAASAAGGGSGPVLSTRPGSTRYGGPSRNLSSWPGGVIGFAFVAAVLLCWADILLDLKFGPLNMGIFFFQWLSSLPTDSAARLILSGLLAVPAGVVFGGVAALLGPTLAVVFVFFWLDNTSLARYSVKAAWILFTIAQYFAVYHAGYRWPFDHRATSFYGFLNDVSMLVGWAYLPLYWLGLWVFEYCRYRRVRADIDAV